MATIKSHTDLPQSKKLAEILPLESADNVIVSFGSREGTKTVVMPKETLDVIRTPFADIRETTPCWSLSTLLNVLPYPQLSKDKLGSGKEGWMVSVYPNDCRYDSCWHDNPVDACYEMILKLHELKESEDERIKKCVKYAIDKLFLTEKIVCDVHKEDILAWLEKQGEQKPADKVEPKFKNGQWIVWQNKCYKVNYNGCGYELVDQNGLSTLLEYETIDKNSHLWTIQDAKDGDVLACNKEILLFKSYSVQGRISLYCWYNGQTNNFHSKGVDDTLITTRNKICPATKEQRNTLMNAMTDAGYTFDFEKKELKRMIKY